MILRLQQVIYLPTYTYIGVTSYKFNKAKSLYNNQEHSVKFFKNLFKTKPFVIFYERLCFLKYNILYNYER